MIYPDSVMVDTFSRSVKSLQRFILIHSLVKDYSRPLLVRFKSIKYLFWYFSSRHFFWFSLSRSKIYSNSFLVKYDIDICWFILNWAMIYHDSIPIDTFSVSVKSLWRFILIRYPVKDYSICWFSLNWPMIYPDSVMVDTFSGSVKSLRIFILIHYPVK